MSNWASIRAYLFAGTGPAFNYYLPFILAILAVVIFCGYHYVLEARRRFRHYLPVQRYLDRVAAWSASLAAAGALLLLFRHTDVPVLCWRIWLYLFVILVGVVYLVFLGRLYGRMPRQLAAHDNELLKRRYLAPANQRQVANAPGRRPAARR